MLLESVTAWVPAQCELDADQNDPDFEGLSSKTRAAFGAAAVEVGDPDFAEDDEELTHAADAIANILHWVNEYHTREGVNPDPIDYVLETARTNFEAES